MFHLHKLDMPPPLAGVSSSSMRVLRRETKRAMVRVMSGTTTMITRPAVRLSSSAREVLKP